MSFQKQKRLTSGDGRPQGSRIEQREKKVAALRAEGTPEARKALKKMNDKVYKGARVNLGEAWNPEGKRIVKASGVKAARISKALKARNA